MFVSHPPTRTRKRLQEKSVAVLIMGVTNQSKASMGKICRRRSEIRESTHLFTQGRAFMALAPAFSRSFPSKPFSSLSRDFPNASIRQVQIQNGNNRRVRQDTKQLPDAHAAKCERSCQPGAGKSSSSNPRGYKQRHAESGVHHAQSTLGFEGSVV